MDETSKAAMDLLRRDDRIAWALDHLLASFAEGVTQSAKDVGITQRDFLAAELALPTRERTKREKYETSRPYSETEKLELIQFAFREIFVTLPAVQAAAVKALQELGSTATTVEFEVPDDEERSELSYARKLAADSLSAREVEQRFRQFSEKLVP